MHATFCIKILRRKLDVGHCLSSRVAKYLPNYGRRARVGIIDVILIFKCLCRTPTPTFRAKLLTQPAEVLTVTRAPVPNNVRQANCTPSLSFEVEKCYVPHEQILKVTKMKTIPTQILSESANALTGTAS